MRAVVQRVVKSSVAVIDERVQNKREERIVGEIQGGLCILLGVGVGDTEEDAQWLADKIANLRIFEDDDGKMNRSLLETGGGALVVSQFTLYGDCRKGRRPSFVEAAPAEEGNRLYEYFVTRMKLHGIDTECGVFQTHMRVEILNDGPVTLILDTHKER
ncbi:MAG: D-tyrosyl-tRNA(Tyr) deacylase [Synergistaceae bacterium]|jgi:D-tyrosyl-tRNA(Tyr) deacylase|nr:D-tyrosyl-tRNA(Tyr) deacylase [Synergistaceae bacterium]